MEAIEKAKVAEFAAKVASQLTETNITTIRLQGAKAALDYVLALDPVELGEEDEVEDADVEELVSYLEKYPLDPSAEYEVEQGEQGEFGEDYTELSQAVDGAA